MIASAPQAMPNPSATSLVSVITWLYEAIYDRSSDFEGQQYWSDRLREGMTTQVMAGAFMASPEFQARYGAEVSDNGFVRLLYNNLFEREPDMEGWGYWTGRLASGMSRAQVVESFIISPENQPSPMITAFL